ncbi:hypothetical protein SAMN05216276_102582 [Streptosporangium subroseum]|uniref:Uncharacterized protein n=1 Tax=Streptosporangium subroseum TaxID=106412 RepID=A0A239K3Y8_9ACTN|nr:hypothetical protein SAMN05216276_102582 [Streptosporangium subroseum]
MAEAIRAGYGPGVRRPVVDETASARRKAGPPVRMRMLKEALR